VTVSQPILATLPATWTDRYLALLGIERHVPGLEVLARLTRAHLKRVLFGSVSSLLRRQAHPTGSVPPLDLSKVLESWEHRVGSGVCFEIAEMVHQLLIALGYRAHIVLGTILWPGGHQGVVVELDGRRYLIDVGNGAPFFEPILLDGVVEVWHVGLGYRFHPGDDEYSWIQDRFIDGGWQSFCTYDLRPASAAERETGYQRHHVYGGSFVVSTLRVIRCTDNAVSVLADDTLTLYTDAGKTVEAVGCPSAFSRLAADILEAPNLPINEARAALVSIRAASTEVESSPV